MRGEVDIFLFPILHWAWPIVQCSVELKRVKRETNFAAPWWSGVPGSFQGGLFGGQTVNCDIKLWWWYKTETKLQDTENQFLQVSGVLLINYVDDNIKMEKAKNHYCSFIVLYPGLQGGFDGSLQWKNYDDDIKQRWECKIWKLNQYWNGVFLQVSGVLLIAPTANSLESRRREFSQSMKEVYLNICIHI